jgi:hypothetical protein
VWAGSGGKGNQGEGTDADTDNGEEETDDVAGKKDGIKKNTRNGGKIKMGKNQVEPGTIHGNECNNGQVTNASTAKRCTGVHSNGNGATANEGGANGSYCGTNNDTLGNERDGTNDNDNGMISNLSGKITSERVKQCPKWGYAKFQWQQ